MNKNAYEIRLDILKMAKEMADQQYHEASTLYWNTISSMAAAWNKNAEDLVEQTLAQKPQMYSTSEIMEKAQQLYGFVVDKKD